MLGVFDEDALAQSWKLLGGAFLSELKAGQVELTDVVQLND